MILICLAACLVYAQETNQISLGDDPGTCICDLTESGCDYHCCCDSDCPSDIIELWEDESPSPCLPEKFNDYQSLLCDNPNELTLENGKDGMRIISDAFNRVLCPVFSNIPDSYNYHELPSSIEDSVITTRLAQNVEYSDNLLYTAPSASQSSYSPGDLMRTVVNGWRQLEGIWSIPSPDANGRCNDNTGVQFMYPLNPDSCLRSGSNICTNDLTISNYVENLQVLLSPTSSTGFTPTLTRVTQRDLTDFSERNVTLSTTYTTSEAGSVCTNALLEAHYSVQMSSAQNAPATVSVEIVIGDVDTSSSVQQRFSIKFYNGSGTVLDRSGNPGYIDGKPVFAAAFNQTDNSTAYVYNDGLRLVGPKLDGSCITNDLSNAVSQILLFGVDTIVTCYLNLTFAELSALCDPGTYTVPTFFSLQTSVTHFGKWGNIDFTNADDWLLIDEDLGTETIGFVTETGVCNLQHTLVYDIVVANYGTTDNPQKKIVVANRGYKSSTFWQFKNRDQNASQRFMYSIVVNFVDYEEDTEFYVPPVPNPIPTMPDDIMYPFKISSALWVLPVILWVIL